MANTCAQTLAEPGMSPMENAEIELHLELILVIITLLLPPILPSM
jgi:hypothetical protein